MVAFGIANAYLLAAVPLVTAQKSFLQLARGHRATGDWDETEVKLCTFDSIPNVKNKIKVFADEAENTRYVSFVREGYATDDGFIESMQKCKGSFDKSCKPKDKSSDPPNCVDCSCELDTSHEPFGNYQKRMLEMVAPLCQKSTAGAKEPFRVLLVGLGGGALAQHVFGKCPEGTQLEAIEYDPRMIEISTRFFGLTPHGGALKISQGDGGEVVASQAAKGMQYDMVLVDAFAGGSHVPESCRDDKFVTNVRKMLRKGGTVVQNLAGPTYGNLEGPDDYKTAFPTYKKVFGDSSVKLEQLGGNGEFPSRLIVASMP